MTYQDREGGKACRVALLVNRNSANGDALADEIEQALEQRGFDVAACGHSELDDCRDWLIARATDSDVLAVAGGDGSLNAMLPALLKADKPFLAIPTGTANDFAGLLGIPEQYEKAIDLLEEGKLVAVDVGTANDHHFLNAAHIGLAVAAHEALDSDEKARLGFLSYPVSVLRAARNLPKFKLRVRGEGLDKKRRSVQVSVGNSGQFGGGWKVTSLAQIDDGKLDLCNVRPAPGWRRPWHFMLALTGRHTEADDIDHWQSSWFTVHTKPRLDVTADGEVVAKTPVRFDVKTRALHVFVPETAPQEGESWNCSPTKK